MQKEDFTQKASSLLDRINSITFQERKHQLADTAQTTFHSTNSSFSNPKQIITRNININMASPQTQTSLELCKIERELEENQEENSKKLKEVYNEIKKIETYLEEENETRVKINETFICNMVKIEKNLETTLKTINKFYNEKQKKLQSKMENVLRQEKQSIEESLHKNVSINEQISKLKQKVNDINIEVLEMKKSREELEDRITTQFNEQINELKNMFISTIKFREQKEIKILENLKQTYKQLLESVKKEQIERESNEKMFLNVIEQLIQRIVEA